MKKRNILVLFAVLLLAGCTPEYNLEIKKGTISERLTIKEVPINYTANDFKTELALPENNEFYNMNFNNNIATYQYKYDFDNITKSNMINSCYNAYNFYEENDYYILQTGSKFTCYPYQINDFIFAEYNELTIKIKVNEHKVLENNADLVDGNTYIWKINENNYNNKPILLKFQKIVSKKTKNNNDKFNPLVIL